MRVKDALTFIKERGTQIINVGVVEKRPHLICGRLIAES